MNHEQISRIIKRGMFGLLTFDFVVLLYIFVSGQLGGVLYGTTVLLWLSYFAMFYGIVGAVGTTAYAVSKRQFKLVGVAVGYLAAALLLFVIVLVLAISTIY